MPTQIFVNMHVKDLAKSKAFFEQLRYSFNPQFSDENAACLVISDTIYCMLLTTGHMERFIPKGKSIADATKTTETLLALSCDSKDAVNTIYDKAIGAGATECRPVEDPSPPNASATQSLLQQRTRSSSRGSSTPLSNWCGTLGPLRQFWCIGSVARPSAPHMLRPMCALAACGG